MLSGTGSQKGLPNGPLCSLLGNSVSFYRMCLPQYNQKEVSTILFFVIGLRVLLGSLSPLHLGSLGALERTRFSYEPFWLREGEPSLPNKP